METTPQNLREWLNGTLEDRMGRNTTYSVRAFARDLKLDPSQLSSILRGKKGISVQKAQTVARRLGLNDHDTERFVLLAMKEHGRSLNERNKAQNQLKEKNTSYQIALLNLDTYKMISDWQNTAILEYLRRPNADQSVKTIAKSFGILPLLATQILTRLERLKMIEKKSGKYHVLQNAFLADAGIPSESTRKHHAQILKKAEDAVFNQGLDQREFCSTELVIDRKQLPEMKLYLRRMWNDFCAQFAKNSTGDAVYEFSYQLFELGEIKLKSKGKKNEN